MACEIAWLGGAGLWGSASQWTSSSCGEVLAMHIDAPSSQVTVATSQSVQVSEVLIANGGSLLIEGPGPWPPGATWGPPCLTSAE